MKILCTPKTTQHKVVSLSFPPSSLGRCFLFFVFCRRCAAQQQPGSAVQILTAHADKQV